MRFVLSSALTLVACASSAAPEAVPASAATPGPGDPERGRIVWTTVCIACHNADPSLPGAIGPEVKGASRELIAARVLTASYPPGYKPKRDTRLMQPLPQVEPNIDDLAAFLR